MQRFSDNQVSVARPDAGIDGALSATQTGKSATSPEKPAVASGRRHTRPRAFAKPLRVMHVINRLDMGGTEYGVLKIMAGLSSELFEHRICTLRGADPDQAGTVESKGPVFVAGRPDAVFQFPLFRLIEILKAYRPHIVHSRNWGAIEAIPAARLAGVPVVIHSEHGYELEMLSGLPRRRRLFRRFVYVMADALFTVSGDLRDYHAKQAWISPERVRVIHNGVDTERFAPCLGTRGRLRQELGLPAEAFLVGTVGRMVPIKDYQTLLRAVEILVRRGVNARLLFVGAGPELARHQQYAETSPDLAGRAIFVGASNQVPELLNAMDVFVLTSIREGMSNTLLEAMASGLPLIATRVGGNPEVIEEGRTGWLIQPGDVEALAERLVLLATQTDLRSEFGAAARQRALEHFRLQRMLEDYRNLYLELAERRGLPVVG